MTQGAAFRGQPLLLLTGLVVAWVTVRAATWEMPFAEPTVPASTAAAAPMLPAVTAPGALTRDGLAIAPSAGTRGRWPSRLHPAAHSIWHPLGAPLQAFDEGLEKSPPAAAGPSMLIAGLAQVELPAAIRDYIDLTPTPPSAIPQAAPLTLPAASAPGAASRWSFDGWVLWRSDIGGPLLSGEPSYGRSQAGAVVRYRLADGAHRPQIYARASTALEAPREREIAAGLSARPLGAVPIRLAAEARATETAQGTEVRPAAFAVTELPPLALPLALRGEAYGQAGYVGGRYATAFIDGQARVDGALIRAEAAEVRFGAGLWGGAQKGAARLDIGPTATIGVRVGDGRMRLSADYRFRVAGDAAPASGPAITLSAGF